MTIIDASDAMVIDVARRRRILTLSIEDALDANFIGAIAYRSCTTAIGTVDALHTLVTRVADLARAVGVLEACNTELVGQITSRRIATTVAIVCAADAFIHIRIAGRRQTAAVAIVDAFDAYLVAFIAIRCRTTTVGIVDAADT